MKKILKILLIIVLAIIWYIAVSIAFLYALSFILSLFTETHEEFHFNDLKEKTNVSFKSCHIISSKDSHGGFLGDGTKNTVYDCGKNFNTKNIEKSWKALPLSENLEYELYGGEKDGVLIIVGDGCKIPKIEKGYYYFIDHFSRRYKDVKDIYSDEKIGEFGRSSNYSITVYDIEKNYLYYCGVDT